MHPDLKMKIITPKAQAITIIAYVLASLLFALAIAPTFNTAATDALAIAALFIPIPAALLWLAFQAANREARKWNNQ